MKCNRCGKEIDELEVFCSDCKNYLKEFSSRTEVRQLEELIIKQKEFEALENTKELVGLDKIVEEELEKKEIIQPQIQTNETVKNIVSDITRVDNDFIEIEKEEKRKKKIITIMSIIFGVLFIISGVLLILFILLDKQEKPEENVPEVVIEFEKAINAYGDKVKEVVEEYINTNKDIPTWQYVIENVEYNRYEVECLNHIIYEDGNIYLSDCTVNNEATDYIYGEEQEEKKEGKKITIYKENYNGFWVYLNESNKNSVEAGFITCKSEECSYVSAYDKFVLVKENNEYYLYDYTNNSINFGPFDLNNEYDTLVHNNELYGIIYRQENQNNIYNVKTSKILKNIKGSVLPGEMGFDPTIMYKYNYAVLVNDEKNNFVNLKTGNISYTIKENIIDFVENESKKIVYIVTLTNNDKYKIYNSTGKALFSGKEYSNYILDSNNLLIATETSFKVYDTDLKLIIKSNDYDQILGLYSDCVIALKDNDLIILNIEDKEYTKFEDVWDSDNNIFYNNLSGKKDGKIIITVENKKIPYGTQGNAIEYYYDLATKESGFTEKISVE